jgi:hypothetical protein
MQGVVIGHGSHDGTQRVIVPDGLPHLDFFTDEGSGLPVLNLLALVGADHPRTPMHTLVPGAEVPNYQYAPFDAHELLAITTLGKLPATSQVLLVGTKSLPDPIRLCDELEKCPPKGPHTCTGLFGRAAQAGWQRLQIMSCRINTKQHQLATHEMMGANGKRTVAVWDTFHRWVMTFLAKTTAEKDAAWAALSPHQQISTRASDAEMLEWSDCYQARQQIAGAMSTPAKLATVVTGLTPAVQLRLLRDHPELRPLVRPHIPVGEEDLIEITAFLAEPNFRAQAGWWLDLDQDILVRMLTDPRIVSWATALYVIQMVEEGLSCASLVAVMTRLDPATRAIVVLNDQRTRHQLTAHAPNLLT